MKDNIKTLSKVAVITLVMGLVGCGGDNGSETYTDENAVDTTIPSNDWRIVWQDEFDGSEIDSAKWTHEINCNGGGNQERQCYTENSENSFLSDGNLNIVVLPTIDPALTQPYTSARLNSKMKGDWAYGRFEVRMKLPAGQGSFPAAWMMPTDETYGGWPHSGEIDIVESVNLKVAAEGGTLESHVFGTLHYGRAKNGASSQHTGAPYLLPNDANPADDFHTYAIEWQEGEIRWYVDDYLYQTQRKSEVKYNYKGEASGLHHKGWYTHNFDPVTGEEQDSWTTAPFDQRFFMILNFAVGGNWAEASNDTGVDPAAFANGNTLLVDYVRVYQCDVAPNTGEGCATIRAGYNEEATEERPDGALIKGAAPTPPPPPLDPNLPAPPLVIFQDEIHTGWEAWDCCGDSTPTIEIDDPEYGEVVEFMINGDTVIGFTTRVGHGVIDGTPFNASNMVATGTVEFDLKMTASPGDTTWMFKIESDEASTAVEIPLPSSIEGHAAPVLNTWQHYTFNIADLVAAGLDPTQIDVLMIFPAWGTGNGALFRVDNLIISKPEGNTGPTPSVVIFDETNRADWLAWDCCAGSTPAVEVDDAEHNNVIEFGINGDTVMGFSTRAGHGATDGVPFDASAIVAAGTLSFELKMTASPGDTTWMFKVESNEAETAVEIPLSTSVEGHAAPELGVWQTYTFNIVDLVDAGLDPSAIDVLMIFPAWGTGTGAVYRVDNVIIGDPDSSTPPPAEGGVELVVFEHVNNPAWPAWDCCAGSTPAVVTDEDATYGSVLEFSIGAEPTVMGFMGRDQGSIFDASSIEHTGVVEFDFKLTASPGDVVWNFKIESNGGTQGGASGQDLELELSASNEAHAAPELGVWQHYSFNIADLVAAGIDPTGIDVLMIFPAWGAGNGATYRVDNVRIGD